MIETELKQFIDGLVEKNPKIIQEPHRMGGQPTLLETRVRVIDVLWALCQAGSIQGVIDGWEWNFTEEDIKAALAFAIDFVDEGWCLANKR